MAVAEPPTLFARVQPGVDPALVDLIESTDPNLVWALGDRTCQVTAEWEPVASDDEPTARLRLTDADLSRSAEFTESDLHDEADTRWRLLRLWMDLNGEHIRRTLVRIANEGD